MNEIIRVLVVLFFALLMTDFAQEAAKVIAEPRSALMQEDVTGSAAIDRSSPLWILELSAVQDLENERLKQKIQICNGC